MTDHPRVVVVALGSMVPRAGVRRFVNELVSYGASVDLVVMKKHLWPELPDASRVHCHVVKRAEDRTPVKWTQNTVLFTAPRAVLGFVRRIVRKRRLQRVLDRVSARHEALARVLNLRLFWPVYRHVRPRLIGRAAHRALRGTDFGGVDRIVAADLLSVPLGLRLARDHPAATATTALDASPYRSSLQEAPAP
ncbi:hypothetical protein AB0J38_26495 [Streptomyces sp. NPDC050095]|uniref:hypothetical protein n=1 Tax=unclassified Streptomyces TaxID=2593676 RepID=UPI0034341F61